MKTYYHKYHVCYPLNIYVEYLRNKIKSIKEILHFWSFVTGLHALMEKVDEEIEREEID